MAVSQTPVFLQTPKNVKFQITSTMVASTNPTIYTAGANGSRVYDLIASGNPSTAISVQIAVSTGGTPNYVIGTFNMSTNAGVSAGVGAVDIFTNVFSRFAIDTDGNRFIPLAIGDLLVAIPGSSIASGNVNIFGSAADF